MSNFDGPEISDQAAVALSAADADNSDGGLSRPGDQMDSDRSQSDDQDSDDGDDSSSEPSASGDDTDPPSSSESSEPTSSDTSAPTTSGPPQERIEDQVVDIANAERADAGCKPLLVDQKLAQAAQEHSSDMADRDYFDHTTPEGLTFAERIVNSGYPTPGAENIARGQQNAEQVMKSWMESDGHRANILNCDLTSIGVGLDEDGMYWTQDFGY
ncbi:CAP domain-containing protein [Actinophytocola sp.]|uniref:CAP domain-containing protein n=1 Tax=Actinophytocola sp. TaxID=1872138 RepID=UPI003D6C00A1